MNLDCCFRERRLNEHHSACVPTAFSPQLPVHSSLSTVHSPHKDSGIGNGEHAGGPARAGKPSFDRPGTACRARPETAISFPESPDARIQRSTAALMLTAMFLNTCHAMPWTIVVEARNLIPDPLN